MYNVRLKCQLSSPDLCYKSSVVLNCSRARTCTCLSYLVIFVVSVKEISGIMALKVYVVCIIDPPGRLFSNPGMSHTGFRF